MGVPEWRAPGEFVAGRREIIEMSPELKALLEKTRDYVMTDAEIEAQRISFAYGNTRLENRSITRATVRRASKTLKEQAAGNGGHGSREQ